MFGDDKGVKCPTYCQWEAIKKGFDTSAKRDFYDLATKKRSEFDENDFSFSNHFPVYKTLQMILSDYECFNFSTT